METQTEGINSTKVKNTEIYVFVKPQHFVLFCKILIGRNMILKMYNIFTKYVQHAHQNPSKGQQFLYRDSKSSS